MERAARAALLLFRRSWCLGCDCRRTWRSEKQIEASEHSSIRDWFRQRSPLKPKFGTIAGYRVIEDCRALQVNHWTRGVGHDDKLIGNHVSGALIPARFV